VSRPPSPAASTNPAAPSAQGADAAPAQVARLAAEHLKLNFPDLIAQASSEELTQAAVGALERARGHGFNRRRQMYFMVHLSTALGSGFDSDPQYRWLQPLLDNQPGLPASHRSRVMCWHVDAFRARAYGGDLAVSQASLARLLAIDQRMLSQVGQGLATEGPRLLSNVFPRRLDFMDRDAMFSLLNAARRAAAQHPSAGQSGAALLLLLMFLFGHQVLADPLRLWLRPMLTPLLMGQPVSVEQLMRRIAEHAAANLDALWRITP
jgi:hypothetical protein